MRVTVISDFHGVLPVIEPTDLLLICGDVSPFKFQGNQKLMKLWFATDFRAWVAETICDKIIMIPGNHDFYLENLKTETQRENFEKQYWGKVTCLWNEFYRYTYQDENKEEKELKIFGTPYCHIFGNWPFMREPNVLSEKFSKIPEDLDILLTHDPVFGLGDSDVILKPKYPSQAHYNHVGNEQLKSHLMYLHDRFNGLPKYCFCGHIHSGDHEMKEYLGMKYANVSLMDEYCKDLVYEPLVFEL